MNLYRNQMLNKQWLTCAFVCLISALSCTIVFAADSATESKAKLNNLADTVKTQQAELKAAKMSRKELLTLQEESAKAATKISQTLLSLESDVATQSEKLANLTSAQEKTTEEQAQQMAVLVTQLRAIQRQAQPNYLQALLSQEDPADVARGLTYYRYFHEARAKQMAHISEKLALLTTEKQSVVIEQAHYQSLLEMQQEKQEKLAQHITERKITVAALDKKIASQDEALSILQSQQKKLENLVKQLNRKPPPKPEVKPEPIAKPTPEKPTPAAPKPNGKARQWPLEGKVLARYGSKRNTSKLKWQGIMIGAKTGQKVSAAAAGRVVFADWMRGFGSLLIIEHSNNYMTLYGNNQALLRKVGDKVAVGDLLAYSGNDGIRPYAGLYFEVRRKGEPIDPVRWLKK